METIYSFFKKATKLALATCFMMTLSSCEDILGEWDKPSPQVQEVINTIVTVTGADPSAVTAALKAVVTDEAVAAAAAKGEPIKVTVAGSGVSTDATDQTITIPQKSGAAIEINFATVPSGTDSNALVLEASEGAGTLPGDANNNLVVTMPPSEGLAITIELPQTTVTLKTDGTGSVVYKDVIAKTAKSTIIIDKGVTIKEHELVGGNIIVKDGGAIETIAVTIKDNFGFISLGEWWSKVGFMETGLTEYYIKKEDGSPYIPKNVRVKKGGGDYFCPQTRDRVDKYVEKLIVDDGIIVALEGSTSFKNFVGEGDNTKLHLRGFLAINNPEDDSDDMYNYDFSTNTDVVRNFAIKAEIDNNPTPGELPNIYDGDAYLVIKYNAEENGSKTFTFENCAFDSNIKFIFEALRYIFTEKYVGFEVNHPQGPPHEAGTLEDLLALGVPNKQVERGDESGGYWIDEETNDVPSICTDFTCILEFKNCTIGGNAITTDNVKFLQWGLRDRGNSNIHFKVIINDNTYNAVTGGEGVIELINE